MLEVDLAVAAAVVGATDVVLDLHHDLAEALGLRLDPVERPPKLDERSLWLGVGEGEPARLRTGSWRCIVFATWPSGSGSLGRSQRARELRLRVPHDNAWVWPRRPAVKSCVFGLDART